MDRNDREGYSPKEYEGNPNDPQGDSMGEYGDWQARQQTIKIRAQKRRERNKFLVGIFSGVVGMLLLCSLAFAFYSRDFRLVFLPKTEHSVWEGNGREPEGKGDKSQVRGAIGSTTLQEMISKIALLEKYIDNYYLYELDEVNYVDGIYKGMLESLNDVYSVYYTKEEYDRLQEQTEGNYCGLGAYISQDPESGEISLIKVMSDSAAEEAGMEAGDILYSVGGKRVSGKDLSTVVSWLKGEEGTRVDVVYYRDGKRIKANIKRKQVETESVAYEMLEGKIGYLIVSTFADSTKKQFRNGVRDLTAQGAQGLIIDLRDNGGGVLGASVDMVDCLLKDGVIVSTRTKAGEEMLYEAKEEDSCDLPMVVLINGNSASASEIFAGALKDHGIATLVGTKTFGKGIVQTLMPLEDGSAIKLTTAEYFTPSGKNIQGTGIEPDVEIALDQEALEAGYSEEKDNQLQKAIEVMWKMVDHGL